jgi:hypothetical protein
MTFFASRYSHERKVLLCRKKSFVIVSGTRSKISETTF